MHTLCGFLKVLTITHYPIYYACACWKSVSCSKKRAPLALSRSITDLYRSHFHYYLACYSNIGVHSLVHIIAAIHLLSVLLHSEYNYPLIFLQTPTPHLHYSLRRCRSVIRHTPSPDQHSPTLTCSTSNCWRGLVSERVRGGNSAIAVMRTLARMPSRWPSQLYMLPQWSSDTPL